MTYVAVGLEDGPLTYRAQNASNQNTDSLTNNGARKECVNRSRSPGTMGLSIVVPAPNVASEHTSDDPGRTVGSRPVVSDERFDIRGRLSTATVSRVLVEVGR